MATSMKDASRISQEGCFAIRNILFTDTGTIRGMSASVETFLSNLEAILALNKWSNRSLAQKSGLSDRLIGMYRNRESVPSLDKAERIAKALGFELWQMQMPGFRPSEINGKKFNRLFHAYLETDDDGRRVMETTADYVTTHKNQPSNDKNIGPSGGNEASGS